MTIILGIDPGLNNTGWGVIKAQGSKLSYISCGAIKTKPDSRIESRLLTLYYQLQNIIETYHPEECAMEETFVNKNNLSSLKLGQARGALMLTMAISNLNVYEYAPNLIKKSVVGAGKAEKHQVMKMVEYLLPGADMNSNDASDALAVAICHSSHMKKF
jgi:crossover junction endodeoxyribonuclease RuvC